LASQALRASLADDFEQWVECVGAGASVPTADGASPSGIGAHGLPPLLPRWADSVQPDHLLASAGSCGPEIDGRPGQKPQAPPGCDAREQLRARLEAIRAAGPGAAAHLLAAEDVAVEAALLRRLQARNRGGGWVRAAGWFLAPIVPCVISVLAARYQIAAQASVEASG
jgi:hypothetical protein